ncbi:MAG: helix-turn-helix domain-containing protein [Oceanicaulis sp.]|uniref:MerR family transcriptional regulator n=1 Tax=Glycocaulis sp. TaxID=1969725 RepID=UPI0025B889FD|nr:helix-turn-helix domain-containing protein [Glycocaulis sp.]MCC5981636.1 helix-turn-helix domain-containing protein [Oceanicaulis sp.]MCH8521043.1 helix-turn-helix domain-containing protein [Glycocaulis sp.]
MHQTLSIGELARRTGCQVVTIRYYEQVGLLPEPERTSGGHRAYTPAHLRRLDFIKRGRSLGFPLATIAGLLDLLEDRDATCSDIDALAEQHLEEVRVKIADLRAIEARLEASLKRCGRATRAECAVAGALAAAE